MRQGVRNVLVALGVVTILAATVGTASAREKFRTSATIGTGQTAGGQEFLDGKVKSPKASCRKQRKVILFWDDPAAPPTFRPVAMDTSSRSGRWKIDAPDTTIPPGTIPPGRYYVKVRPKGLAGDDRCKGARSRTITV